MTKGQKGGPLLTPGKAQCSERACFTTSTSSTFFMLLRQMAPSWFLLHLQRDWLTLPSPGSVWAPPPAPQAHPCLPWPSPYPLLRA